MGSKNDNPGKFFTPMAGKISTFKLVHVSGEVGCSPHHTSKWGCFSSSHLFTFITDDQNSVVFPENDNGKTFHTLPGFTFNSPELLFTFSVPLEVTAGQEYRVWYSEDLFSFTEYDNYQGAACMRVIVIYSI